MNAHCLKSDFDPPANDHSLSFLFGRLMLVSCFLFLVCGSRPAMAQAEQPPAPVADGAKKKKPSLADLLLTPEERQMLKAKGDRPAVPVDPNLPSIDDDALVTFGIRKLTSRHLILYTDLPRGDPFVDEIPRLFDQAVKQWATYFEIPEADVKDWKIAGSLIKSKKKFQAAQLLPDDLPPFLHGYQRGRQFWVYEQDSPYYRRHLVFHEGVHGFMFEKLGGGGPPWYREGVAEFLATHQLKAGTLKCAYMPRSREEVPLWGRIRVIKSEYAAGRPLMLREVMRFDRTAHLKIEPYAWCWAAVAFLDGHLRYKKEFQKLKGNVKDETAFFTREFENAMRAQSRELDEEWQLFIANMDYGYDLRRNAVQYRYGTPLPKDGRTVTVSTDTGWQSTGVRMEKGKQYLVAAKGRFKVKQHPKDWWSEPGGITIQYENGMPLGVLLGNIRRDEPLPGAAGLVRPIQVGLSRRVSAAGDGTLYLRVNESASGLSDNSGQISVKILEFKDGQLPKKEAADK